MAYTTTELITRAWYLSGIVARDLQTVTGDQLNDGVQMLNALLDLKTANQRMIPYYKEYDFTAVIGQEKYAIPDLILVETLTFTINSVRYAMEEKSRSVYFGTPRANDIQSLPYIFHVERAKGGSNLYMYFLPQEAYAFKMVAKFSLADVALGQDLSLTLDGFYLEYLRYALAEYMCQEYNLIFQPQNIMRLREIETVIFDISPLDLTTKKKSILTRTQGGDIYAQANIGHGWTR